jgi:beta-glucosidase
MKKPFLKFFILFILTLLVGCECTNYRESYGLKGKDHTAIRPVSRIELDRWEARHKKILDRISKGNVDLIFIGDSITHSFESRKIWEDYYGDRNAVNMGFGGDRTQHVLWRLQNGEINGISPKLAVLMIGTNNSNGQDNTAEEIADGIKAICAEIRSKLPETKILLLAIFPRGDAEQRKTKGSDANYNSQWAKNDKASEIAAKIADGKMIHYLNINQVFLNKDGVLTREIMPDLLHPKAKGYRIWAESIEYKVKELMGEH